MQQTKCVRAHCGFLTLVLTTSFFNVSAYNPKSLSLELEEPSNNMFVETYVNNVSHEEHIEVTTPRDVCEIDFERARQISNALVGNDSGGDSSSDSDCGLPLPDPSGFCSTKKNLSAREQRRRNRTNRLIRAAYYMLPRDSDFSKTHKERKRAKAHKLSSLDKRRLRVALDRFREVYPNAVDHTPRKQRFYRELLGVNGEIPEDEFMALQ